VKAAILAGTVTSIGPGYPYMSQKHFLAEHNNWEGWNKYNREYCLRRLRRITATIRAAVA
jgi:hypothetical protein